MKRILIATALMVFGQMASAACLEYVTCDDRDECTVRFKEPVGPTGDNKCAAGLEYRITNRMFEMINGSGNSQRQWTGACDNGRNKKVEVLKVGVGTSNAC